MYQAKTDTNIIDIQYNTPTEIRDHPRYHDNSLTLYWYILRNILSVNYLQIFLTRLWNN